MEQNEYAIMYTTENTYWWYRGLHELVGTYVAHCAHNAGISLMILDAGCGTGRMMELVQGYGSVEGVDYSQEALKFCAYRGLRSVASQDLTTWIPPQGKYDIIISLDVLCHRAINDEEEVYGKFFQALKPGGMLILNLPAFELLKRKHDQAVHTKKRFVKRPTMNVLEKKGYHIACASYRLPFLFAILLAKKAMERISSDKNIHSDLKLLPNWLNSILLFCNRIENMMISSGFSMPFGSSLFLVAQK